MLSAVSLWLTEIGYRVSVIGRSKQRHHHLVKKAADPTLINNLSLDYNNHSLLEDKVRKAIQQNGPISLVISWIPSKQSLDIVNKLVSEYIDDWKLYQVKGSRRYFNDDILNVPSNCTHSSIYLGFIIEGNQSRWLTNNEIAEGVIKSIQDEKAESIIGRLHPYEKRPNY
ncbi:hypothetical protein BI350_07295 [Sporosarcina ureilytica]|uniref:Short-chain dehydrogenase n=2 Tax=Sporosarcina ureilytica TaxID=298596 RepID=A0A1D8JF72_9BACL|nr:hypothetical protein BI350_07295 [Sporosarcina ureilytica]